MNKGKGKPKGAIEIIEEAICLLRFSALRQLITYYIGALPFILGLLFFFSDMIQNAYAPLHCSVAAFGMTLLFIWMKCWHSVFALQVKAEISHLPTTPWTFRKISHLIFMQTIIQPTGIFVLPFALLATLPFPWAFAFYQNASAQPYGDDFNIKNWVKQPMESAKLWPLQNVLILCIFFLFSMFVFLNIGLAIFIFPYMLKKFLGIETVFTLSGMSAVLNYTFWTVTCSITYLCMDPIIKTVYALRCFYGESIKSGDDIKAELKSVVFSKIVMSAIAFCLVAIPSGNLVAYESTGLEAAVTPEQLDQSITQIMKQREFTWRLPREKVLIERKELFNPFLAAVSWVKPYIKKVWDFIKSIKEKILRMLKKLIPESSDKPKVSMTDWMTSIQAMMFLFFCITACTLVVYIRRIWLKKKGFGLAVAKSEIVTKPDIADDHITAAELPVDGWLEMAKELLEKGALRLSLRAFYLATLAHLADNNMVTIAQYKSNRDYAAELCRRAHEETDLLEIFTQNVTFFDRAWYGMYKVDKKDVMLFSSNYKRIIAFAK